jgi:NitT/TauT family transport system ATP-binding protein
VTKQIDVKSARKVYETGKDRLLALDGVTFSVRAGEFVSLLGPSGCGKSTLLWAIAGLRALDNGSIELGGERVTRPHRDISIMFQRPTLLPWRSLRDNVLLPLELRPPRSDNARDRIDALISRVGLDGFETRFPKELSGGMQQRASIVRSLAPDPEVLLLDEPFSALDPFTREAMNLLLQDLWLGSGRTMVLVTHNIEEAVLLSDRVLVMTPRPGRISRDISIDLPRPRSLDLLTTPKFFELGTELRLSMAH